MPNLKDVFFYWIHFPSSELHDCCWVTDVEFISRDKGKVKNALKDAEIESTQDNEIKRFESDVKITGSKVWVLFSYDAEDPCYARIQSIGNTREECLEESYKEFPEEEEWSEKETHRKLNEYFGLKIKEMEIS